MRPPISHPAGEGPRFVKLYNYKDSKDDGVVPFTVGMLLNPDKLTTIISFSSPLDTCRSKYLYKKTIDH